MVAPNELSRAAVTEQLRALGVKAGGVLLVHTSFRAVRPVESGPLGLIAALRDALGPDGTLVMPSMSDNDDAPFDPATSPSAPDLGIVADTFWRLPGAARSNHPFAFAATGPQAAAITTDPLPLPPHIAASPVGRVHDLDGQVLLLGCGHSENTTLHLAEILAGAPYRVLQDWQEDYQGNLLVILPDTYGTTNFLKHAPDWVASWTGIRIDSKDPIEGGEEAIDWWLSRGQNPHEKLAIFSDGLDVDTIIDIHRQFHGRVRVGYGWGTLLTNDFRGLALDDGLAPISIVCKVLAANGRPAVKISDNPTKAIGPRGEIERYKRVFDVGVQTAQPVLV